MRLVGVELVRVSLPLLAPWVTEAGEFSQRDSMLVRVIAHALNPQGEHVEVEGWGECGALPGPTYTSEYTAGAAEVALRYTSAVVEHCESLGTLPYRGTPRDDIRPGLRTIPYKRRTVIAYTVDAGQVSVIGVFHGGQDYESELQPDSDPDSSSPQ